MPIPVSEPLGTPSRGEEAGWSRLGETGSEQALVGGPEHRAGKPHCLYGVEMCHRVVGLQRLPKLLDRVVECT